jgi:hypothetical protein
MCAAERGTALRGGIRRSDGLALSTSDALIGTYRTPPGAIMPVLAFHRHGKIKTFPTIPATIRLHSKPTQQWIE